MGFLARKLKEAFTAMSGGDDRIVHAYRMAVAHGTPLEIAIFARELVAECYDDPAAVTVFFDEARRLFRMQGPDDPKLAIDTAMLPFMTVEGTYIPHFPKEISDAFKPGAVAFLRNEGREYAAAHPSHVRYMLDQLDKVTTHHDVLSAEARDEMQAIINWVGETDPAFAARLVGQYYGGDGQFFSGSVRQYLRKGPNPV